MKDFANMKPKKKNLVNIYLDYDRQEEIIYNNIDTNRSCLYKVSIYIPIITNESEIITFFIYYKWKVGSLKKKDLLKSLRIWNGTSIRRKDAFDLFHFANQIISISIPELINFLDHCRYYRLEAIDDYIKTLKKLTRD